MSGDYLTTGWEPDLAADDSLLRRFVLANVERSAFLAHSVGGASRRWDDVAVADPASPVLFDNLVALLQPPEYIDIRAAVQRAIEFYPPERHFLLLSAWPTPDLSAQGLELMGHPPLMLRPPGGTAPPVPDGLDVVRVRDAEQLDDFLTTLIKAYPLPKATDTALGSVSILDGPVRLFVGYVDGRPVATSGARIGGGLVDVEWVSTRSEYRRRGIGAALTWAATLTEPSLPGVLIASDDGQPVYQAMGHLRLMRLTVWHRPPHGSRS